MPRRDAPTEEVALRERLDEFSRGINIMEATFSNLISALIRLPEMVIMDQLASDNHNSTSSFVSISPDDEDPRMVRKLTFVRKRRDEARAALRGGDLIVASSRIEEGEEKAESLQAGLRTWFRDMSQLFESRPDAELESYTLPQSEEESPRKWSMLKNALGRLPGNKDSIRLGLSTIDQIVETFVLGSDDQMMSDDINGTSPDRNAARETQGIVSIDQAGTNTPHSVNVEEDSGTTDMAVLEELESLYPSEVVSYKGGLVRRDEMGFAFAEAIRTGQPFDDFLPPSYFASRNGPDGCPGVPPGAWDFR